MPAVPGAAAVTSPDALTVATVVLSDAHATVRPLIVFPAASRAVAVSVCVAPTESDTPVGATVTLATTGPVTVTLSDADFDGSATEVALTCALPAARPTTVPVPSTDAT